MRPVEVMHVNGTLFYGFPHFNSLDNRCLRFFVEREHWSSGVIICLGAIGPEVNSKNNPFRALPITLIRAIALAA